MALNDIGKINPHNFLSEKDDWNLVNLANKILELGLIQDEDALEFTALLAIELEARRLDKLRNEGEGIAGDELYTELAYCYGQLLSKLTQTRASIGGRRKLPLKRHYSNRYISPSIDLPQDLQFELPGMGTIRHLMVSTHLDIVSAVDTPAAGGKDWVMKAILQHSIWDLSSDKPTSNPRHILSAWNKDDADLHVKQIALARMVRSSIDMMKDELQRPSVRIFTAPFRPEAIPQIFTPLVGSNIEGIEHDPSQLAPSAALILQLVASGKDEIKRALEIELSRELKPFK